MRYHVPLIAMFRFLNWRIKFVLAQGGVKSGFAKSNQKDDLLDSRDAYLLHVRGSSSTNTKAIEVPRRASSLNSNDAFVLVTKTMTYMWAGKV